MSRTQRASGSWRRLGSATASTMKVLQVVLVVHCLLAHVVISQRPQPLSMGNHPATRAFENIRSVSKRQRFAGPSAGTRPPPADATRCRAVAGRSTGTAMCCVSVPARSFRGLEKASGFPLANAPPLPTNALSGFVGGGLDFPLTTEEAVWV